MGTGMLWVRDICTYIFIAQWLCMGRRQFLQGEQTWWWHCCWGPSILKPWANPLLCISVVPGRHRVDDWDPEPHSQPRPPQLEPNCPQFWPHALVLNPPGSGGSPQLPFTSPADLPPPQAHLPQVFLPFHCQGGIIEPNIYPTYLLYMPLWGGCSCSAWRGAWQGHCPCNAHLGNVTMMDLGWGPL